MVKKFLEYIKEDSATTAVAGSGTAVGGGATGSFTTASGTAISGGDSGTAFATNSNTGSMGAIVSAQPSPIPGDVAGSQKGGGDIGHVLGTYGKYSAYSRKKKGKKTTEPEPIDVNSEIKNLYIVKFNQFDGVKNIKENQYTEPVKIKCQECGMDIENNLHDMLGHVYLKHWAKQHDILKDFEPRMMVKKFFHVIEKEKK